MESMTPAGAAIYRAAARARNEIYGCQRKMGWIIEQAQTADTTRLAMLQADAQGLERRANYWLALLKNMNRLTNEEHHERS